MFTGALKILFCLLVWWGFCSCSMVALRPSNILVHDKDGVMMKKNSKINKKTMRSLLTTKE